MIDYSSADSANLMTYELRVCLVNYKSIIFDFDGTLANSADVVSEILDKLIEKHNFTKVTPKELKHRKAASFFKKIQMMGFMLKIQNEFKQMYGENISKVQWYNDMPEVLQALSGYGYQLAILSSNSSENIKDFLKVNAIDFPYPVLNSKGFFGKHKTIKEYITAQRIPASDVLYIGDEIRDVKACNKAGIDITFVTWGADSDEDISNFNVRYIAKAPSDILTFLQMSS